jgi:hypothetical protein
MVAVIVLGLCGVIGYLIYLSYNHENAPFLGDGKSDGNSSIPLFTALVIE